jgi:hypothetical protein
MKLHEIVQEQDLQEGPLLNKIGTGVGNIVGGVAKAAGAVAGGIAGLGAAAKKGFQAGKKTVAGAGDEPAAGGDTAAPAATGGGAPTAPSSGGAQTQTPANPKDTNTGTTPAAAGGPPKSDTPFGRLAQAAAGQDPDAPEQPAAAEKPADQPQAAGEKPAADSASGTPQTGTMKGAPGKPNFTGVPERPGAADSQGRIEPTMGAAAPANDPEFQKVQQNIGKLPPEQQKELMAALMADPEVKKALEQPKPAADDEQKPEATPAAQPETPAATPQAGDQTTTAKPARQRDAKGRFIGKNAPRTEPAPTQAEIDADRNRLIPDYQSVIRQGKALSENTATDTAQTAQQQRQDSLKTFSAIQQGFERGRRNPFGSSEPARTTDSDIADPTGTVSLDIIDKLNSLSKNQKSELVKKLKAKMI